MASTRPASAPIRVLVIDDDPLMGSLILRALAPIFDVVVEGDPIRGLAELLDDPTYDVVLCDVQMPSVTGPEILSVLRRAASPAASRFVFMTASNATDFPDGRRTNGCPILRKPLSMVEVRAVLRGVAQAN